MTEKEFREFREDVKERLVRLETEQAGFRRRLETGLADNRRSIDDNRRGIDENRRRIDENHREMQANVRRLENAVARVESTVQVILTMLEEREKHEKRNRTVLGIIVGAASTVIAAVVSFFTSRQP